MSNTNDLNVYRTVSIMSVGIIITTIILLIFFPIFSSNYLYEVGTIMIFNGRIEDIPKGWALCDGQNNTPNLTNKFIVGCWSSDIPTIESLNTDKNYVGPGINPKYITNPSNIKEDNITGLIGGNVPYIFGQQYTYREHDHILDYDHGTNWFKNYVYRSRNTECDKSKILDEFQKTIKENEKKGKDSKEDIIKEINKLDYNPKYQQYYKNSNNIDLCTANKQPVTNSTKKPTQEENYIMNDNNLIDKTIQISKGIPTSKNDFDWYFDIDSLISSKIPSNLDSSLEVNNVSHIPLKKRVYRDYEDYKFYLEHGKNSNVSCYKCLSMNHTFNCHKYTLGVNNTIQTDDSYNNHLVNYPTKSGNNTRFKEYMNNFVYENPYSNNPSYFQLAYIIRVK